MGEGGMSGGEVSVPDVKIRHPCDKNIKGSGFRVYEEKKGLHRSSATK